MAQSHSTHSATLKLEPARSCLVACRPKLPTWWRGCSEKRRISLLGIASPREGCLISVSGTGGSNGSLEPAVGDVRSIVTGCHNVRAVHGKAPLGTGESARSTCNGVNLRYGKDHVAGYGRSDNSRIDAVSISRFPMSRSCVREVRKV